SGSRELEEDGLAPIPCRDRQWNAAFLQFPDQHHGPFQRRKAGGITLVGLLQAAQESAAHRTLDLLLLLQREVTKRLVHDGLGRDLLKVVIELTGGRKPSCLRKSRVETRPVDGLASYQCAIHIKDNHKTGMR